MVGRKAVALPTLAKDAFAKKICNSIHSRLYNPSALSTIDHKLKPSVKKCA
jgi:hypothetical protein